MRSFISLVAPVNIIELEDVEGVELDNVEFDVDIIELEDVEGVELDSVELDVDIIELEKLEDVELDEVVPGMETAYLRTYLGM